MRIFGKHHHNHDSPLDEAPLWAVELFCMGLAIYELLERKMSELDDKLAQLVTEVTANKSRLDSLVAYQAGLKQQLADALAAAGAGLTAEQRGVFDQVFAAHKAEADEIDAAIPANTPAA